MLMSQPVSSLNTGLHQVQGVSQQAPIHQRLFSPAASEPTHSSKQNTTHAGPDLITFSRHHCSFTLPLQKQHTLISKQRLCITVVQTHTGGSHKVLLVQSWFDPIGSSCTPIPSMFSPTSQIMVSWLTVIWLHWYSSKKKEKVTQKSSC